MMLRWRQRADGGGATRASDYDDVLRCCYYARHAERGYLC